MPPSQKKASKKQKTAEKAEKAPPAKKKKESMALVEYDRMSRVWIYQIIDPETKKVIYIGRTKNLQNRVQQHDQDSSACKQLREYIRLHNFTVKGNIFVVPELPEGVPFYRAAEFEGVFIEQRGTIYNSFSNRDGCNLRCGDNITSVDTHALWAEVQAGYKWPETSKNTPSSVELLQAECEVAILEDMVKAVGDVEPTLSDDLRLAKSNLEHLQRTQLGVTELCEAFAADYEKLPRDEVVDRAGVIVGMNLIKQKLEAEEERDEQMLALIRAEHLFLKDTESRAWNMSAQCAVYTFHRLATALESREIERMEKTPAVTKMLKVRAWSYAHGQKLPKMKSKDATARSLGTFLDKLKGGRDACYQGSDAECAFLMRNLPAYAGFLAYNAAKTSADLETSLKQLLVDGYGFASEPAFEGKKPLERSEHKAEYIKLLQLTRGKYDEKTTDRILADLPPSRIAFYKTDYATKRAEHLKKKAEYDAKGKAKLHANGVKPRKRSRVETEEEADTEEPEEAETEEADEEADEGAEEEEDDEESDSE
jgi:hypothetical protein